MHRIAYYVSPDGRVPTDESIKIITARIMEDLSCKTFSYKCGPSINNPHKFLEELETSGLQDDKWELVLLYDTPVKVRVLSLEEKRGFIRELNDNDSMQLTGYILLEFLEKNQSD